jgi:hypothetical protein
MSDYGKLKEKVFSLSDREAARALCFMVGFRYDDKIFINELNRYLEKYVDRKKEK